MILPTFRVIFILALLTLFSASGVFAVQGHAANEGDAPVINEIEFRGLKRIQEPAVRPKITHMVGGPLYFKNISDEIKNIYGTGFFEDVAVEIEPFEGGLKLIYILKEKPTITGIDFRGNEELDDLKLKEVMTLTPGTMSDIVPIQENVDKLRGLYEKEGYFLVRVVPIIRRLDEGRIFLTYQIEEGPKVKITDIFITGNKAISSGRIKDVMETKERWLFSFLTGSGRYESSKITSDIEKIKDLYLDHGFLMAEVSGPVTELSKNKKKIKLTIQVKEGEVFRIASIGFSGNTAFKEEELREKIKSTAGPAVSMKTLRDDVGTLTEMYTEKGYALASVYPDIIPDEEKKEVRVSFNVREDAVYKIGRIEFSGNQRTRDKVIRREFTLNEGDTFNSKRLKRSYQKINNLNLFESIDLKPAPDTEKKTMDITLDVKERPTGFVSIGAGYSSTDRFIGMFDITQGNLGGRAQTIKLKGEFSSRSSSYSLSFRDPWFLDKPVSFTTGIYRNEREYTDYEKKSLGFMFGFGKGFWDYWGANISYNYETATIFNIKETASSVIKGQAGSRITSSISPSLWRDTRDNFLDPHTGSKNALYLTYAGVGGDNKFLKATAESGWFLPVSERTTASFMATYGYATGLFDEPLPLYERFYVGGIYTIRGLGFGEAGPRDEKGAVIGGAKKVIFNIEYTFPLIHEAHLKGVIFYDTGTAYDRSSDIKFRQTAGWGIRWISPIGPLRLEWGYILDRRPGERPSRWEFTFGTFF